jgi:hypothetical protein
MDPGLWFASESRARLTERRAILRFVPVTAPAIAHMRVLMETLASWRPTGSSMMR